MADKPWLKSYPPGMPEFADVDAYQSVVEVFDESVRSFADRVAFYSMGASLSYRQVDQQASVFASWILTAGKLSPGRS